MIGSVVKLHLCVYTGAHIAASTVHLATWPASVTPDHLQVPLHSGYTIHWLALTMLGPLQ